MFAISEEVAIKHCSNIRF